MSTYPGLIEIKLTDYGKQFFTKVGICLLIAVLIAGAIICLFDYAYLLHIAQKYYNVLYIAIIMPAASCGAGRLISDLYGRKQYDNRR